MMEEILSSFDVIFRYFDRLIQPNRAILCLTKVSFINPTAFMDKYMTSINHKIQEFSI